MMLAKTLNLNKVKITFPSSKLFELSKPSTYNSSLYFGEMSVYLSYCLVWGGVGDDRLLLQYCRSTHFSPAFRRAFNIRSVSSEFLYIRANFHDFRENFGFFLSNC